MPMKKIALVTGSSRGIGRAIAKQLALDGYHVCINCKERMDLASDLAEKLNTQGYSASAYQADVSDRTQVDAMVQRIQQDYGPVSLLVNNAGIASQCLFQEITEELWHKFFANNLDGAFHCTQAVLPAMLHEHEGCIINISSIWGQHGASCEVAYSCTKHAIIGLTKSLSAELAPSHIRVNAIAPGVIVTDMLDALPKEVHAQLRDETPLGRLGVPDDIAQMVSYLASEKASFITGQVFTIDGGFIG